MKKSILNLKGVSELSKGQLQKIQGGKIDCDPDRDGICNMRGPQCGQVHCQTIFYP